MGREPPGKTMADLRGSLALPQVACVAVTATMHLLFLVAFSWMLVEGLLLWNKVVAVSMRPGPSMRFCYAMGWGETLRPAPAWASQPPVPPSFHLAPSTTHFLSASGPCHHPALT